MMLIGFTLRVYRLAAQSLWYDEAVSWYLTQMSLPQLTTWTANDIQPPLYYYFLWFWVRLAGTSEYALRFPSVLYATLTLPMLWRLARRLFGTSGAWLALLLALLSPFHVYYAQEARMYTLLAFLGLTSTCLWLRLLGSLYRAVFIPVSRNNMWTALGYAITMAAALYTHYFAVFLLAAHLISWMWIMWCRALHPVTLSDGKARGALWSFLMRFQLILISLTAIWILYIPWLPFLLGRYVHDPSYWPGTFSIAEMARRLFLAFTLGETVKEAIGVQLAFGFGIIFLISLAALIWINRPAARVAVADHDRDKGFSAGGLETFGLKRAGDMARFYRSVTLPFLLSWIVVPVAFILLLAWQVPKFNPRYAILAWPALVLILAGGLSVLMSRKPLEGVRRKVLLRSIGVLALVFMLATSIYSLYNWYLPYRDNQFNKADFRITAQIVRERIAQSETILLSSGHMAPAWAYYYGWEGWDPVPALETLDVRAVLDLSVGDHLTHILAHKSGVWLVRWQNEITDPFNVLPLLLGVIGTQDDHGQFWHMELYHYRLSSRTHWNLDLEHIVTHPVHALLGGQIRLVGLRATLEPCRSLHDVSGGHTPPRKCIALVLVWQAATQIEKDYAVFVHLQDDAGTVWTNGDHLPARPTSQWPIGRLFPDQLSLEVPPEMPEGTYWLEIGLYDPTHPELPRLGPVVLEASDALQPGERILVPISLKEGQLW
ncbi:MAG: glycosyltransferase family 39 protein [Anaerolineae bacterium]